MKNCNKSGTEPSFLNIRITLNTQWDTHETRKLFFPEEINKKLIFHELFFEFSISRIGPKKTERGPFFSQNALFLLNILRGHFDGTKFDLNKVAWCQKNYKGTLSSLPYFHLLCKHRNFIGLVRDSNPSIPASQTSTSGQKIRVNH